MIHSTIITQFRDARPNMEGRMAVCNSILLDINNINTRRLHLRPRHDRYRVETKSKYVQHDIYI